MAEIYLIRHGQSANNAGPDHTRVPDPGLTELGTKQATATANWLATLGIDQLFCSPFLRSLETTRPAAGTTKIAPTVRPELCEKGGCYSGYEEGSRQGEPGMKRSEISQRYPGWNIDATINEEGWWNREYEKLPEARARAQCVIDWMKSEFSGFTGNVAMIIHADFKQLLIEEIVSSRIDSDLFGWMGPLRNVGATHFSLDSGQWKLHSLNATSHLPGEWITG